MAENDRTPREPAKITIDVPDLVAIVGASAVVLGAAIVGGIGAAVAAVGVLALGYAFLKAKG